MKHLKFKAMMILARLGLATLLRFTFMQHVGIMIFFAGMLMLTSSMDTPEQPIDFAVAVMFIGFMICGSAITKLFSGN